MRKLRQILRKVEDVQNQFSQKEYNGIAIVENKEVINVILDGKANIKSISVDLASIKDVTSEILEKLVIISFVDAFQKINTEASKLMSTMLGKLSSKLSKMKYPQPDKVESCESEFSGSAGGNLVNIVLNNHGNIKSITIDPSVINDQAMLEDLLVVSYSNAKRKFDAETSSSMSELFSGKSIF
ncbi:DNA-binding protein, YbaB/EbfC family [Orientia chuto str. Dubai]|uniref:DNA-binding protein, YbaB/EbfC family n=1 Tax=Orientia chuto str. Dubai TaxID=1359168 RepID=A0A0F3MNW9_9RICK|nr:YbaB/EbfC family nucleoid-associated protein [Candidatus Orientia mediorientalis]KJV56284.1 DNA-binding protein, YbaB/EbfC family [Orientia chuto str. Dubai]